MRRVVSLVSLAILACACAGVGSSPPTRTPVTSGVSDLGMSPQELRIRVRSLIRPTLGIVEEYGDRILVEASDPGVKRAALVWKIEMTTTLLAAMLRNDPVLALADAWGYVLQVETCLQRPDLAARFGSSLAMANEALDEIQDLFRDFGAGVKDEAAAARLEAVVREWADEHPIEGELYRRPSMDSSVADLLAAQGKPGALAALGGLEETTTDIMMRMDLYTTYLPRLARWEAEVAAHDLVRGVDPATALSEFERFTRATDRIAGVAESAPGLVAGERQALLDAMRLERLALVHDLREERAAIFESLRAEREATLEQLETMMKRLIDSSGGALHESFRLEARQLVAEIEQMRERLLDDTGVLLERTVDRVFVRALVLLLVAAALAVVGVLLRERWARRPVSDH